MDEPLNQYVNDFNTIDYEHILLSYVGKSIKPRYILGPKVYPISIEINNCIAPFGVDNAYGKLYMKISLPNNYIESSKNIVFFTNIDTKLSNLVMEKEKNSLDTNLKKNIIQTILDKNISIVDSSGNITSLFGITKGTHLKTLQLTLGDIFYVNKTKNYNYKWIVNKIIL
jgi:hypothetical protein